LKLINKIYSKYIIFKFKILKMSKALQANQGPPPLKSRRKENTKYLDSLEQA
jgi:hypothetical protein